jgi:hypothetical protein
LAVESLEDRALLNGDGIPDGAVFTDLGTVDFLSLSDQQPAEEALLYRLSAARDGILTAELSGDSLDQDTRIALYQQVDGQWQEVAAEDPQRVDYDGAQAGGQYAIYVTGLPATADLLVANLVEFSADGAQITVNGTDGDDLFLATVTTSWDFSINGLVYQLELTEQLNFRGGGGDDRAEVIGTAGDDVAAMYPGRAYLAGQEFAVEVTETSSIAFDGGGGGTDLVWLFDSPGDDHFTASPGNGRLTGDGFDNEATGFRYVHGDAASGGHDVATMSDSPGDDQFVGRPAFARLDGNLFSCQAEDFDEVQVDAGAGGVDTAKLYDSAGNDHFEAAPSTASLSGPGFDNRVLDFELVQAYATAAAPDRE